MRFLIRYYACLRTALALVLVLSAGTPPMADAQQPGSRAPNFGSVAATRHNLTMSYLGAGAGWMSLSRNDYGEVCVYCHTPRDAYCTSCHDEANGAGASRGGRRPPGHPPVAGASAGLPADEPEPTGPARALRLHDRPPRLAQPSPAVRAGERLFQANCAFCHAADGTGRSWFGRFIDPPPRDLTDPRAMAGMTRARLSRAIEDGVDGSSMPAWRGVLAAGEIEAIAAYVERAFIAPADAQLAARRWRGLSARDRR